MAAAAAVTETRSAADLASEVERLQREIDSIEEFEREWSTPARKKRLAQLQKDQHAAAKAEADAKYEARENIRTATAELEELYEAVIAHLPALNEAVERLQTFRGDVYMPAFRRAQSLGVPDVPVMVAKLSTRASRDRSLLNELHRLRAWAGGDP